MSSNLDAISPVDGRYSREVEALVPIFSEWGLMKYRLMVEVYYLTALSENDKIGTRKFSDHEKKLLEKNYADFSVTDAEILRDIEFKGYGEIKATEHDVKAVEYYLKHKLRGSSLADSLEWIHFALTSEDVNNLAYGLMLSDGLEKAMIPALDEITEKLEEMSSVHKNLSILARTHGQPASPTTFGKEFRVFSERIKKQLAHLRTQKIEVKLNGASGNFNAHLSAYPDVDWEEFAENMVGELNVGREIKLERNRFTTQIEPHDTYAELFDQIKRINTILIDFDQDVWRYVSDGWFVQKPVEGEIGSSAMPHKINPIKFENSEGNLGLSNALLEFFSRKLPISRLQRDLSDSTIERNFGVAFSHSLVGYRYIQKGLSRLAVNEQKVTRELESHPEVIAEAIQTVLRREGMPMPYERLKELTRGKNVTIEDMRKFIDELDVSKEIKKELKKFTPLSYTGMASKLAEG